MNTPSTNPTTALSRWARFSQNIRGLFSVLFSAGLIAALLFVVFMGGCKDESPGIVNVCVAPTVIRTSPANGDTTVSLNKTSGAAGLAKVAGVKIISATFSTPMDANSITSTTFIVQQGTTLISGTVSYSDTNALFVVPNGLQPNLTYTCTITTGARDVIGTALASNYVWSFTTVMPYTVTLSSIPLAGGTTSGSGTFNSGSSVTVTAAANAGYTFTNWTENGIAVSTNASYTFTINGNKTLVANFAAVGTTQYAVTLSSIPAAGGTTSGSGTFNSGSSVTVSATANSGYAFTNWTENGIVLTSSINYQFTISKNRTLVANFTAVIPTQYTVTLLSIPLAGGTTSGSGAFNSGSSVTVSAAANSGYTFTNWTESGTAVSTNASYTFTISGNKTLVANFTAIPPTQYTVTLSSIPSAGGTTSGSGTFNSGSSVTVTATANAGYTFTNWTESGTVVTSSISYTFTINGNKTLVANFTAVVPTQYTVTLLSIPLAGGSTSGGGAFNSGSSVIVTAAANAGYKFNNWTESGTAVSTNASYTFTISGNRTLVANFVVGPGGLPVDLGSAGDFAILAGSGVSNTGVTTHIYGDVGSFPTATIVGLLAGNVTGTLYTTADPIVGTAKTDLTTAYNDAQGRSLNAISLPGQLGGLTLAPGLYVNSSSSGISGTGSNAILTLDAGGDANAVWVFKMGSTLITDAGTSIVLAGGADWKNIFWSVGSSATLGTNSIFYGNILADQAITLTTGAALHGRALTRVAAVTLDASTIDKR